MAQEFKPIYLWAQALDNQSEDDFYEISSTQTIQMQDLPRIQAIVSEMGDINENDNNQFVHLLQIYNPDVKSIVLSKDGNKILLVFKTQDKDHANRHSNIDVLLDISQVTSNNLLDYATYFYRGFETFSRETGRTINVLSHENTETYLAKMLSEISQKELPKLTPNPIPETIVTSEPEQNDSQQSKKRNIFITIIVAILALIVSIVRSIFFKK